jgi:hypothetical protein
MPRVTSVKTGPQAAPKTFPTTPTVKKRPIPSPKAPQK